MYRNEHKQSYRDFNITLNCGGLGDGIAHMPAVKYVLDHHGKFNFFNIWVHDYLKPIYEKAFGNYNNCKITGISERKKYKEHLPARSPYAHKISNLSCHMVDHGFYTIVHKGVENKDKNYIQLDPIDVSDFNLPEKYVVVTTGYTSPTRKWKGEYVNDVSDYLNSRGYTPVYLGRSFTKVYNETGITGNFEADYSKGINLIDKTDMFQAHGIIAKSVCVLGIDNGLLHLSGMSQAPIIYGCTTVDALHRLPYRNDILGWNCYVVTPTQEELACIHCQSNQNFAPQTHNFTECFYKDYKCLDFMTADKWIEQLEKIL